MSLKGLEATQDSAFTHLLSPFALRDVALRNRTVFQPHFTALGDLNGMPTDDLVAYHEERARGGVGLIITESQAIHPTGKMSARFLNAWDPAIIPGLAKVAAGVHTHGAKIFAQLTHGGHTSLEHPPHIMWAPTQMPEPSSHFSTKALIMVAGIDLSVGAVLALSSVLSVGSIEKKGETKPTLITKANVDDPEHWGNFKK